MTHQGLVELLNSMTLEEKAVEPEGICDLAIGDRSDIGFHAQIVFDA